VTLGMANAGVEGRRKDAATHAVADTNERREPCSDVLEHSCLETFGTEVKASE
jgi:hypothetical protein